jgi:TonB-linked SusC/RagA family outer membrane protein
MKENKSFKSERGAWRKTLYLLCILACFSLTVVAQKRVTGTVIDATGETVVGANVVEKGTTNGTSTDADGRFALTVKDNAVLQVSFIGYVTQEIRVGNQTSFSIRLAEDSKMLEEVMVVAYGVAKKSTFTGSAALIKAEQMEKIGNSQFLETLQGTSAGVNITNNEGAPGGNTRIQIRGIANLRGDTNPLYVVDGVPYDGQINSIASSDIESLTVLKDAAASSLYGSRAANGVVVITTKKGAGVTGKPVITFKGAWGTSATATPIPEKADPYQTMIYTWYGIYEDQVYNHAMSTKEAGDYASRTLLGHFVQPRVNSQGQTVYVTPFKNMASDQYVLHDGNGNPYTNPALEMVWKKSDWDWFGAVYSAKLRQDYSIDISGASNDNKTNYYVSASHLNDLGYSLGQYFKRYSFRTNVTSQVTDWLTLGGNLAYTYSRQNRNGSTRLTIWTNTMNSPWLRNADNTDWEYSRKTGHRMKDYGQNVASYFGIHALDGMAGQGDYWNNPDDYSFNNLEDGMMTALYFFEIKLPFDLKWKTNINLDDINRNNYAYSSAVHGEGQMEPYGMTVTTNGGSASRANTKTISLTWNNLLSFEKKFGDHSVSALIGHEYYSRNVAYQYGGGSGIMMIDQYETSSTTTNWSARSTRDRYGLLSFFGKADYNFRDKYYLSGSYRTDGSSRFHPDNRWGNFFSVGASWRLSQENFLEDTDWLNNLALRGSYGTTGNDNLGTYYAYQATYTANNLFGKPGYRPATNEAPDLKWEQNQQYNFAVDFGLFDWLNGTVEYYTRNSKGLLATKALPLSANAGAPNRNVNLGDIRNRGVELTLNAGVINKKDFSWNINANFTTVDNKILYLPGGDYTWTSYRSTMRYAVGHSIYEHFMITTAGVDPETGKMKFNVKDENGNWKTTTNWAETNLSRDGQFVGSAVPKGFGSLTNSFNYKDLDFSFMWYGSYGSKLQSYSYMEMTTVRDGVSVIPAIVEGNYWLKPGDNAKFPRPSGGTEGYNSNGANQNTDMYVLDNSFLRLRNITLGYTLPKSLINKASLSNVRIYVTLDNALTLFSEAHKNFTDPESGIWGNDYNGNGETDSGIGSARKVFMGGIQVSF